MAAPARTATTLVLDTSGSMAGQRIESAISAARGWVSGSGSGDIMGLVTFANTARTLDFEDLPFRAVVSATAYAGLTWGRGAGALGDIGRHFPPSDPKWKAAASDQFLAHAYGLLRDRGGRLTNVDVTLICERPKIGPHADAMRKRIAEILSLDVDRVSVKATTTEKLGFTGRREGVAAMAAATAIFGA